MNIDLRALGTSRGLLKAVVLITLLHCALWYADYSQTALGESPALDNRQTLELAQAMAQGKLPAEPFHRAPLYPYLLSIFLTLGTPYELLPWIARWLNALALAITAASASWIALRIWGKLACGWAAGLLVALNPVLLFFSGDAFDILLATAPLFVAIGLLQIWLKQPSLKLSLMIGTLLTLGAALRSHLLPLALLWPIAAFCLSGGRHRFIQASLSALPLVASFLLLGLANLQVAGEFRLMPWQGAYNSWAGNGPDATGRIYAQKMRVDFGNSYDNPAKLESIALYEAETGEAPPHSIDVMNAHWKAKTISYIAEHPSDWLGLMFRKAYYFLNSYEQYDNKTYGFHKGLHPLLTWNPIHWGALFLLAVAGALIGLQRKESRAIVIAFILIFGLYAAGTILFYTSNRFRVPMVPLLAILSAGIFLLPAAWTRASKAWRIFLMVSMVLTLGITYSGFFNARETNTWEEDYALLANAALRTGRDDAMIRNANAALQMNPERADMHAVLAQGRFNKWALQNEPQTISEKEAHELLQMTRLGTKQEPHLVSIVGIYKWKIGQHESAVETWQDVAATDALARLCLIRTGKELLPDENELPGYREHPSFQLLLALTGAENTPWDKNAAAKFIDALLRPAEPAQTQSM